ncbi:MAG TPA: hypothetical protein VNW52_10175, partial [Burkholderiaceae bacterium]|nr:hypothetical protein [Burkholderiaceae bacterium]
KILPVAPTDLKVGTAAAVTIATLYGGGFSPSANAGQGVPPPGNGSEAGNIVAYNPVAAPPRKAVPGKQVSLTWKTNGYQLDFRLFYDGAGKYVCASGQISNPDIDINDLAFILPITLMGTAGDGQSGAIALTVIKGGDGYDLGIKCESTLPGFGSSGLVVEFGKVFGAKAPKKNW